MNEKRKGAVLRLNIRRLPLLRGGLYLVTTPDERILGGSVGHTDYDPFRDTLRFRIDGAGFELSEYQEAPELDGPEFIRVADLRENDLFRLLHKPEYRSELRHAAGSILRLLDQMDAEDRRR